MNKKETFERLKHIIINDFREEIIWYKSDIEKEIDVYIGLNLEEDKIMFFFTNPELEKGDVLVGKIKTTADENDFNKFEDYIKNLNYDFLPLLQFNH
ncbi:MAG: hypothetical protein AB7E37_04050 [Candidatus Altimarinota bacterium]